MKLSFYTPAAVVAAAAMIMGCGSSQKPTNTAATEAAARATARASVSLAEDVWNGTAEACVDMASAQKDDSIRAKCADVLIPAHDTIEAALNAVNAWTAADQKNWPCLMAGVDDSLKQIEKLLPSLVKEIPPLVADALTLADTASASCNADGGK